MISCCHDVILSCCRDVMLSLLSYCPAVMTLWCHDVMMTSCCNVFILSWPHNVIMLSCCYHAVRASYCCHDVRTSCCHGVMLSCCQWSRCHFVMSSCHIAVMISDHCAMQCNAFSLTNSLIVNINGINRTRNLKLPHMLSNCEIPTRKQYPLQSSRIVLVFLYPSQNELL